MIRLSDNQRERLARESWDERVARLLRMSTNQRERLARESQDQREARLEPHHTVTILNSSLIMHRKHEIITHRTSVLLIAITLHMNQII